MKDRWTTRWGWLAAPALLGLLLTACPPKDDTPDEATPAAASKPEVPQTRTDLSGLAHNASLVASPTELQEAMLHAGVDTRFGTLLKRRNFKLTGEKEDVALRTGIVLADMVLTLNESDKDVLLDDLDKLRTGLNTIGAGGDIDATLGQIIDHVKADSVSRQELWLQVEEMREAAYGELAMEAGSQVVPLVQAGSWLEGTHLLAVAVLQAEESGGAPNLLRQPDVVAYFLAQLKVGEGDVSSVNTLARGTLEQMHDIAMKDSLTIEDIRSIEKLTGELLDRL